MFPGSPGDKRPLRHLVPRILPRFFGCIDDGGPPLPNSGIPDPLGWCTVPNPLPVQESQYHCGYLSHSWERAEIQSAQLRIPMVIALTAHSKTILGPKSRSGKFHRAGCATPNRTIGML